MLRSLEQQGAFLFRWRSYLPLLCLPILGWESADADHGKVRPGALGVGLWIPIDFHMIEDLSDRSAPIVNNDYRFGGMLNAFRFGAPPHGGSAPGVDRIVMLLAGVDNIREVIVFPFNQQAQDLMMQAPSEVSAKQLRELHIRVVEPPKS